MELKYSKRKQTAKRHERSRSALKISEHQLQVQCEKHLDTIGLPYIRIPDFAYRHMFSRYSTASACMKGLVSKYWKGMPDLTILYPTGIYKCIELKTPQNKQTTGQEQFERKVKGNYYICRTFNEFLEVLNG